MGTHTTEHPAARRACYRMKLHGRATHVPEVVNSQAEKHTTSNRSLSTASVWRSQGNSSAYLFTCCVGTGAVKNPPGASCGVYVVPCCLIFDKSFLRNDCSFANPKFYLEAMSISSLHRRSQDTPQGPCWLPAMGSGDPEECSV